MTDLSTPPPLTTMSTGANDNRYPCRCGKVHEGDFAQERWRHHNCFHDEHLAQIARNQAICIRCGKSFILEDAFVTPGYSKAEGP